MQISSQAYFGVEALVRLAACSAEGPCTVEELARSIHRSISYTESLMARLRAAGLVGAKKGRHGGYFLSRPPDRMTVAEIFQAFDEPSVRVKGATGLPSFENTTPEDLKGTPLFWLALKSYVLLLLNGVSLADLMPVSGGAEQHLGLCSSPVMNEDGVSLTCH